MENGHRGVFGITDKLVYRKQENHLYCEKEKAPVLQRNPWLRKIIVDCGAFGW